MVGLAEGATTSSDLNCVYIGPEHLVIGVPSGVSSCLVVALRIDARGTMDRSRFRDGLHRLGRGIVNVYLRRRSAPTSRSSTPGCPPTLSTLPASCAAMGRTLANVRALVLTHGHFDAYRLRGARPPGTERIPVSVHSARRRAGTSRGPQSGQGHRPGRATAPAVVPRLRRLEGRPRPRASERSEPLTLTGPRPGHALRTAHDLWSRATLQGSLTLDMPPSMPCFIEQHRSRRWPSATGEPRPMVGAGSADPVDGAALARPARGHRGRLCCPAMADHERAASVRRSCGCAPVARPWERAPEQRDRPVVDGLWTGPRPISETRGSTPPRSGRGGHSSACWKGRETADEAAGVALVESTWAAVLRALHVPRIPCVTVDPDLSFGRDPRCPRARSTRVPELAAVRGRGLAAGLAPGPRQGRNGEPDPLVQGSRHVDSPSVRTIGPSGPSSARPRATSARESPMRREHRSRGRRLCGPGQPRKIERMRELGATVIEPATTSTTRAAHRRRMRRARGDAARRRRRPAHLARAATLALEVTDAAEAGCCRCRRRGRAGRQRALMDGVGSWLRHAAPAVGSSASRPRAQRR